MASTASETPDRNPTRQSRGWAISLGSVLGIPIRVHATFLLLVAWFAWTGTQRGDNVVLSIAFLLLLFGCVLLHELGHATMARLFGVGTRDIVLYPIGGIARLESMPGGKAELFIALAGPAVNVVLAFLLFVFLLLGPIEADVTGQLSHPASLLTQLLIANIALFIFNLVPAFPMDGGRVLRAALSLMLDPALATRIATRIGQVLAVLFVGVGLFAGNPFLVLIAVFVFMGASQEAAMYQRRALLWGHTAQQAMLIGVDVLRPQESLTEAARMLTSSQHDFPVLDAWSRVAGVLSRAVLVHGLSIGDGSIAVLEVMERDVPTVSPNTNLESVLERLMLRQGRPIFVVSDVEPGELLGMLTLDQVWEFLALKSERA